MPEPLSHKGLFLLRAVALAGPLVVLVRQVGLSLKKITRYRDLHFEFGTTSWERQLIDCAGLTSPLNVVEPEVPTN